MTIMICNPQPRTVWYGEIAVVFIFPGKVSDCTSPILRTMPERERIAMPALFNVIVTLDWGMENIRWSLGGEIFSMQNKFAPPSGILFNNPEQMDKQHREVLSRCAQLVPWYKRLNRPKILASVPLGSSDIKTNGFVQILKKEAQSILLCEAPMAAAMGCGYSADNAKPFGILELAAGFSQFAVIQQCSIQIGAAIHAEMGANQLFTGGDMRSRIIRLLQVGDGSGILLVRKFRVIQ
ncbi:MAG: rod shape-determining protein [Victivallaceae bacterium]|nr:rod shape-determining protein [Victivallaceae bacterium]